MRSKRKNVLLLSLATITCAASLIIGSSYAIFTDTKTVNNHLKAGSLKVGLKRTNYVSHTIDTTGTLKDVRDSTVVDLVANPDPLFNISVVPGAWAKATIEVNNANAGNVGFNYGVRILWDKTQVVTEPSTTPELDPLEEFAKNIVITITKVNEPATVYKTFTLDKCNELENKYDFEKPLLVNEKNSFDIEAKFLTEAGNITQNQTINFDMQVYASQVI